MKAMRIKEDNLVSSLTLVTLRKITSEIDGKKGIQRKR